MRWNVPGSVVAAATLLAVSAALAAEETPPPVAAAPTASTPVAKARASARANAASVQGGEWLKLHKTAAGSLLIPVLNRCLPQDGEEVTAFSLYVRLTQKGRVREVVTDLDAALGKCMTLVGQDLQLPDPPRDDYWIQVNLAAEL